MIFHDIENSDHKGTTDTLHWSAFNIPGTAKGLPEGIGTGRPPGWDAQRPRHRRRGGNPGAYFGPGAGPGPFHHYVFEFYALDTKLDLPANTTREELLKAMEGHVIGKAAYVGRFMHATAVVAANGAVRAKDFDIFRLGPSGARRAFSDRFDADELTRTRPHGSNEHGALDRLRSGA